MEMMQLSHHAALLTYLNTYTPNLQTFSSSLHSPSHHYSVLSYRIKGLDKGRDGWHSDTIFILKMQEIYTYVYSNFP